MFELTFSVKKVITRNGDYATIVANNLSTPNSVIQRSLSKTMRVRGEFRAIFEKDTFKANAEKQIDNNTGLEYIQLVSLPELCSAENKDTVVSFLRARIPRLGVKSAEAIVNHLGLSAVNKIIANDSVLLNIPDFKCSTSRAIQIGNKLRECATFEQVGIFIQSAGLPLYVANEIYKKYENNSMRAIHSNPYSICYDGQISFKNADIIAQYLSFDPHDSIRIQTLLIYYLNNQVTAGHTCFPKDLIYGKDKDSLSNFIFYHAAMKDEITDSEIDNAIKLLIENKKIIIGMDMMGSEYIYLFRYYATEQAVIRQLKLLLLDKSSYCDKEQVLHFINNYNSKSKFTMDPLQKEAILTALSSKIMILTGGPGTGKTATVNMIVECIEELTDSLYNREPVIKLLAPTGKAAERMTELTGRTACTIHKELKILEQTGEKQVADYKIVADYILVDESSMIDIDLMKLLLQSLNEETRIIFVGDDDQLPPVGPGCALKDFIYSGKIPTIKLKTIFRQKENSTIVMNSHRAISGYGTNEGYVLESGDCHFYSMQKPIDIKHQVVELYGKLLFQHSRENIMILTPMKNGDIGTDELNRMIQETYNQNPDILKIDSLMEIRVSDKVIQIKNLYKEGLYNVFNGLLGEVQWIDRKGKEPTVAIKFDGIEKPVVYTKEEIKEFVRLAYALTIHKSQGSEFPVVIIPLHMSQEIMLNRNLFYTAITRAREEVNIVGQESAINKAIHTRGENRYSLLSEKLAGR